LFVFFHPSGLTLFTSSATLWRESTVIQLHPTCTYWGGYDVTFVLIGSLTNFA